MMHHFSYVMYTCHKLMRVNASSFMHCLFIAFESKNLDFIEHEYLVL